MARRLERSYLRGNRPLVRWDIDLIEMGLAIRRRSDMTLVAQSMGAFTASLVCTRARTRIRMLAFRERDDPSSGRNGR
jgi:hypothetical protein